MRKETKIKKIADRIWEVEHKEHREIGEMDSGKQVRWLTIEVSKIQIPKVMAREEVRNFLIKDLRLIAWKRGYDLREETLEFTEDKHRYVLSGVATFKFRSGSDDKPVINPFTKLWNRNKSKN
jgi:hypothetical protein